MEQEINITVEVKFLQRQIRDTSTVLDNEVKAIFADRLDFTLNTVETAMGNAILNLTTSVDASLSTDQIKAVTEQRIQFYFPFGVDVETMELKEEAEIYGNV